MKFIKILTFSFFFIMFMFTPLDFYSQGRMSSELFVNQSKENTKQKPNTRGLLNSERIYLETIVSPIAGGLVAIPFSLFSILISVPFQDNSEIANEFLVIGALLGNSIGNAFSLYLFEKNGKNDVSFGNTLVASLIGSAMSVGVLEITGGDLWNNELGIIALISFPTIASIIYANLIAPEKSQANVAFKPVSKDRLVNTGLTHKDYYNSSKLFDLELMRISF